METCTYKIDETRIADIVTSLKELTTDFGMAAFDAIQMVDLPNEINCFTAREILKRAGLK